MNKIVKLSEATLLEKVGGNRFRVRIIQAGQGSSGFYPAEVVKEYGPTAFPKGTHCYVDHGPGSVRSVDSIGGVIDSEPVFEEADEGLYATMRFTSRGMKIVEELKEDVGLSISASGSKNDEGIIESIEYSPLNSVDIVSRAGANGAILELLESFDASRDTLVYEKQNVSEEAGADEREPMTPDEIAAVATAISEALAPRFDALTEAIKPAPVAEAVEEGAEEPDLVAAVEAAVEADLPKVQREAVVAAVAAGTPLEEAVAAQKSLRDQILAESQTDSGGRVVGVAKEVDLTLTKWK